MSKKQYYNYSKVNETVDNEVVTKPSLTEEPEVTNTEVKPEPIAEEGHTEAPTIVVAGVVEVSGYTSLNVRVSPSKDADVVEKIPVGTDVKIYVQESNDEWYKIETFDGIEGFCMKQFIALR